MSDVVRNFISVYGNDAVKATHREVIRRLKEHRGDDTFTHIGEVLYGLSPENANLGRKQVTAYWVRLAVDYGEDDILGIDSGGNTPDQLLNHIVWFYSKVDSDCILVNEYDHENTAYVGGSFRLVRKSKIFTYEEFQHTPYNISEDPEPIDEDEDNEESIKQISWDEFWDIQKEMVRKAKALMLSEYPEVAKYFSC